MQLLRNFFSEIKLVGKYSWRKVGAADYEVRRRLKNLQNCVISHVTAALTKQNK